MARLDEGRPLTGTPNGRAGASDRRQHFRVDARAGLSQCGDCRAARVRQWLRALRRTRRSRLKVEQAPNMSPWMDTDGRDPRVRLSA